MLLDFKLFILTYSSPYTQYRYSFISSSLKSTENVMESFQSTIGNTLKILPKKI